MAEVTFLASSFVGAFALGLSIGMKLLAFKKGVEAIASN